MDANGPIAMIVFGQLAQHGCQLRVLGIIKVPRIFLLASPVTTGVANGVVFFAAI
jgi:hypothetical protein